MVNVYQAADGDWGSDPVPVAVLEAPEGGEEFGSSLGVSDGVVVVGDPFNDVPSGDQGAVWLYDETASSRPRRRSSCSPPTVGVPTPSGSTSTSTVT